MNQFKLKFLRLAIRMRGTGVVLYGHNVTRHAGEKLIPTLHLRPEELEFNIELFKQVGFQFINAEQLVQIADNGFKSDRPWVHLTFDDGYQDNYDVILPILEKHQVPATVFISTFHIENRERFYTYRIKQAILHTDKSMTHKGKTLNGSDDETTRLKFYRFVVDDFKLMRTEEALGLIAQIDQLLQPELRSELDEKWLCDEVLDMDSMHKLAGHSLVTIGSHNHHHLIMNANMSSDEIAYQMSTSKEWISTHLGLEASVYCYPNGQSNDFTDLSGSVCAKYYKLAFTTLSGFTDASTDRFEVPRMFLLRNCISIVHRAALPEWVFRLKTALLG